MKVEERRENSGVSKSDGDELKICSPHMKFKIKETRNYDLSKF
jgi:hypothetical protein